MTRTMYDAVNVSGVPAGATLVAGYGDGLYQDVDAFRARFPNATVVVIAVSSRHNLGTVLDVETGDATPAEAPPWVLMRRAAGVDPTIYCNSSTWPSVRAAFQAAGVAQPHYWIAQYDNVGSIPASWTSLGCVAKQYADPGPYDLSIVADYWPGVDTNPGGTIVLDAPTAAQIKSIVTDAVFNNLVPDLSEPLPGGGVNSEPFRHFVAYMQQNSVNQLKATTAVAASVASLATAVAGIAAAVNKLGTADATLAADLQAAQAGLAAIPGQIAAALQSTVHVHVDVTAPTVTGA